MISDRLKVIIYKKLYEDLSHVEIIECKGEIWFIDREEKFWYFIYNKSNGEMWWRYSFFTPFFLLFSSPSDEFTLILSSWVEEVLNCKVSSMPSVFPYRHLLVEDVLNCKVTTTHLAYLTHPNWVEDALNCKVTTTESLSLFLHNEAEDVLSYRINKTGGAFYNTTYVEEVLNNEV
jgi:hypothetical protein